MTNHIFIVSVMALVIGAFCTSILTPVIISFCRKKRLFDRPDIRKVHRSNNIPRLGGLSFFPSVAFALCLSLTACGDFNCSQSVICVLSGGVVIYITGLFDDISGLTPVVKMAFQTMAGCLLAASGTYKNMAMVTGLTTYPVLCFVLTVFFIVYVCNAINFIDGIDGQCGCISLLAMILFYVFYVSMGTSAHAFGAAATAGTLLVFLGYNMFGRADKGNKIFMGDSGSLSLAYIISTMGLPFLQIESNIKGVNLSPSATVLGVMAVPMLDLLKVALVRLTKHKSIFSPDKTHIHHRLMKAGLSQHQALAAVISITVVYIVADNALLPVLSFYGVIVANAILWMIGMTLLHVIIITRRRKKI